MTGAINRQFVNPIVQFITFFPPFGGMRRSQRKVSISATFRVSVLQRRKCLISSTWQINEFFWTHFIIFFPSRKVFHNFSFPFAPCHTMAPFSGQLSLPSKDFFLLFHLIMLIFAEKSFFFVWHFLFCNFYYPSLKVFWNEKKRRFIKKCFLMSLQWCCKNSSEKSYKFVTFDTTFSIVIF